MNRKLRSGFTLIELMMAIAVLAILIAVAAPAMRVTIQNNRLTTQANDLLTAFQFARSEALRVNGDVAICSSSNGTACGGSWAEGWIVFDSNALPNLDDPADDTRIRRVGGALGGDTTVTGPARFDFQARGNVQPGGTLRMTVPDCRGQQVRLIQVEPTGRVNIRSDACS